MTTRPNWMFRLWLPCTLLVCLVGCPRRTPPGPGPGGGGGSPNVTDAAVDDDAEGIDAAATESEVTDAEALDTEATDAVADEPVDEEVIEITPPANDVGEPADEPAPEPNDESANDESANDAAVTGVYIPDEVILAVSGAEVMLGSDELVAGIPGEGDLTVEQIQAWLDQPENHEPLTFLLPSGLSAGAAQISVPEDNPLTLAKIELGRQLYFDTRMSGDNTISCASCHHPDDGYTRPTQFGVGIAEQTGDRNSPVNYNRILSTAQFWDGRAGSLEEQAVGPIQNPIEHGTTHEDAVAAIAAVAGYQLQFDRIFGPDGLNIDNIGRAIASFERTIVTGPSPYDAAELLKPFADFDDEDIAELEEEDPVLFLRYTEAKAAAASIPMSESAVRGRDLFFSDRVGCTACHVGANFADEKFHNLGVGMDVENPPAGHAAVSGDEKDTGAFKTPTMRNVALSAPYMHDGSQKTLEEVVDWYAKGGHANPHLSDKIKKIELIDQEKADLVAFMQALTGSLPAVNQGRMP